MVVFFSPFIFPVQMFQRKWSSKIHFARCLPKREIKKSNVYPLTVMVDYIDYIDIGCFDILGSMHLVRILIFI